MLNFKPAGQAVYLPNFIVTLVRSQKARPPNVHCFRVPICFTKYDIEQYLSGLYGLRIKHIETTNFLGHTSRQGRKHFPAKKNAVVTIEPDKGEKPFVYPPLPDESQLAANALPSQHPTFFTIRKK